MQEIRCSGFERLEPERTLLENRDDDDGDVRGRRQKAELTDESRRIHLRHLIIGDDKIRRMTGKPLQCLDRIAEGLDRDTWFDGTGQLRKDIAVADPIIDDCY